MPDNQTGLLRSFPRVFWVANVMELFERAAFYGLNSVLAVYLSDSIDTGGLGFSKDSIGFLQSLIYACAYILPIVGGALADRYGYRQMLMVAFSFLAAGYYVSGSVTSYGAVFAALLIMATGAGLFKPIISGTLARSTNEKNSGFGFGVYYWMINVGAFIAPLIVSYLKGFSWNYVFLASALYSAAMLLPAIFVFQDPPKPANTKSLRKVLSDAALVLGDSRFMLMILIYSGFWILYYQNFGTVLWYLRDFVDASPVNALFASYGIPLKFDAEHVTVVNAGTIILLQVFVSRVMKNIKPVTTMVSGISLGAAGFLFLALSQNIYIFIIGLVIFSIGEMTAHPKYYSYIGLVAPEDKKATYMGYAFLYGVVGSLIGSSMGGLMYEVMLTPVAGKPDTEGVTRLFWLIFVVLDVAATIGLILYNKYFSTDTVENNNRARKIMTGVYGALVAIGLFFIYLSFPSGGVVQFRTLVQALIMAGIGGGGLYISVWKK